MCGRFTRIIPLEEIHKEFEITENACDLGPSYNIAPTQPIVLIQGESGTHRLVTRRWGLIPSWAKDPTIGHTMINAYAELLTQKSNFRTACKKRRCLMVADGIFEWQERGTGKVPLSIRLQSGKPFGLAGISEHWISPAGETIRTCAIMTTEANEFMRPIHQRMPVILPKEHYALWLGPTIEDEKLLLPLLQPCASDAMEAYEVSRLVNSLENDPPTCIEQVTLG